MREFENNVLLNLRERRLSLNIGLETWTKKNSHFHGFFFLGEEIIYKTILLVPEFYLINVISPSSFKK